MLNAKKSPGTLEDGARGPSAHPPGHRYTEFVLPAGTCTARTPRSPCGDEGWAGMVFQALRAEVLGDSISESIYPTETKGRARWQGSSWQNGLRDRVGVEEN